MAKITRDELQEMRDRGVLSRYNETTIRPVNQPRLKPHQKKILSAVNALGKATVYSIAKRLKMTVSPWLRSEVYNLCHLGLLCCHTEVHRSNRNKFVFTLA